MQKFMPPLNGTTGKPLAKKARAAPTKKAKAPTPGPKKARAKPGIRKQMKVIRAITNEQKKTGLQPRAPFRALLRSAVSDQMAGGLNRDKNGENLAVRISKNAATVFQEYMEERVVHMLQVANAIAVASGRVTVMRNDFMVARNIDSKVGVSHCV